MYETVRSMAKGLDRRRVRQNNENIAYLANITYYCFQTRNDSEHMTSAVNIRSQLIRGIYIFISVIIQCDGQSNCGPGKVLDDEDFPSN